MIFFKRLRFLNKTIANKLLNGTTGAVGDIQRRHAKQFINLQYFPIVVYFVIVLIVEEPINSIPHFILLFDNVFLLCPEIRVFGWKMLVLSLNVTNAETLGSYHKVNSYYDYYM